MAGLDNPLQYKKNFGQHMGYQSQANEIELYDNQLAEVYAISGLPIEYAPVVYDVDKDVTFGEDTMRSWPKKHLLTCLIEDNKISETFTYAQFGELNHADFVITIHKNTYWKQSNNEPPRVGDIFIFPHNSGQIFEVTNAIPTTLGNHGNIFGQQNCYKLNCRELESSQMDEGIGEQIGVVDNEGNLVPGAPDDVLLEDGRVREKYNVKDVERNTDEHHDNRLVDEIANDQLITLDDETEAISQGIIKKRSQDIEDLWGGW